MNARAASIYSGFLAFAIVLLFFASPICSASEDEEHPPSPIGFHPPPDFGPPRDEDAPRGPVNEQGQFRYMIEVDETGLIEEQKQRGILESGQRFNRNDPTSVVYRQQLSEQVDLYISMISQALDREIVVTHRFLVINPGFSVWLFEEEVEIVKNIPGIVKIKRVLYEYTNSYRSPSFIGADAIWRGTSAPSGNAARGEGMVIAVLDHGINPDHPVFQNNQT